MGVVESPLQQLPVMAAVAELHVWGISTSRTVLTPHLLINSDQLSSHGWSREQLLKEAREHLTRIGIRKCTIELEASDRIRS